MVREESDLHFIKPMVMFSERHDFNSKRLVGGQVIPSRTPTEQNGMLDVKEAVAALVRHPNTAPFISKLLIQFLVTANPSPSYVNRVASKFIDNGSGVRGDLSTVVKAILLDPEARLIPSSVTAGKVREPVIRTMHLARVLNLAETHPKFVWWNEPQDYFSSSYQEPTNAPSVFNFYTPLYQAPGAIRNRSLVSPGFQIVNSFSAISFPNLLWRYIDEGMISTKQRYSFDYSHLLVLAENPSALVDWLNLYVCAGGMTPRSRSLMISSLNNTSLTPDERVALALWVAVCSPESATQN